MGKGKDCMDFESRVWDCDGGDIEEVRGLHLGNRQGNSKKGGVGLKVLIFHYVPHVLDLHKCRQGQGADGLLNRSDGFG